MALVTGGASGLGKGCVDRFLSIGAKVAIADLPNSKGGEIARELGENAIFLPVDVSSESGTLILSNYDQSANILYLQVTKEADVTKALQEIKSKFGRLDACVNCAGVAVAFKTYNFNKDTPHKLEDFVRVLMVSEYDTRRLPGN